MKLSHLLVFSLSMLFAMPVFCHPVHAELTDYRTCEQLINDFKALCVSSDASYEVIGTSVEGRDIYLFKIGNPNGGRVAFTGAIHGYEPVSSEVLYHYVAWLLSSGDSVANELLATVYTLIVPIVNVDRYDQTRKNANGVDLNRNFPVAWGTLSDYGGSSDPSSAYYQGPSPKSEFETQVICDFYRDWQPEWAVNVHAGAPETKVSRPYRYTATPPPDRVYHDAVYEQVRTLATSMGATPFSYGDYYKLLAGIESDTAYGEYDTHMFAVELYPAVRPAYTLVADLVQQFLPLGIGVSQEVAVSPPPIAIGTVTINVSPSDGGTTIPTVGTHTYDVGTQVSLTATASSGYDFDYWSDGGLQYIENPHVITVVEGTQTYTAYFKSEQTELPVSEFPQGSEWILWAGVGLLIVLVLWPTRRERKRGKRG